MAEVKPTDGLEDRDLQKYYEAQLSMCATEGWKGFMEDVVRLYDAANTLHGVDTQRDLDYRRGQRDLLKIVMAHQAMVEAAYENALEEAADNG